MKASGTQATGKQATGARATSTRSTTTARAATSTARAPTGLLELQRVVGNRAVRSLLSAQGVVQRRAIPGAPASATPQAIAARGTRGSGGPLPYLSRIQASFGRHDVSQVQAFPGRTAPRLAAPRPGPGLSSVIGNHAMLGILTGARTAIGTPVPPNFRTWFEHSLKLDLDAARGGGGPTTIVATHLAPKGQIATATTNLRAGVQTPTQVGAVDDPLEYEADRVADHVVRIPSPGATMGVAPQQISRRRVIDAHRPGRREPSEVVDLALRSPGQPLDSATRSFMESRFGYDFRNVRVHTDAQAAQSAAAIGAQAYTRGSRIAFAAGLYQPETNEGRRLLAHELTHVVQQDAGVDGHHSSSGAVQRKLARTWAGTFTPDIYKITSDPAHDQYGIHIHILFSPNEFVDAEKIAFVQTAQSIVRDPSDLAADPTKAIRIPSLVKTPEEEKAFRNRMVNTMDPDEIGLHIDAPPDQRTPLYSMTDPPKGNSSLAGSSENNHGYSYFGHQSYKSGTKRDAAMDDYPSVLAKQNEEASMVFETTALAVEGVQTGAFYGSVKWGFKKASSSTKTELIDFDLSQKQKQTPSQSFLKAAESWNSSNNTAGDPSIPLPLPKDMFVKVRSNMTESPDSAKRVAQLDVRTPVETLDTSSRKGWVKVVVTGGSESGAIGWLKVSQLR